MSNCRPARRRLRPSLRKRRPAEGKRQLTQDQANGPRWRPKASQPGLVGGFGHWKPGWPGHTTCRGRGRAETTSNSAFSGTSGLKGFRLQPWRSAVGQGCKFDRERWQAAGGTERGAIPDSNGNTDANTRLAHHIANHSRRPRTPAPKDVSSGLLTLPRLPVPVRLLKLPVRSCLLMP